MNQSQAIDRMRQVIRRQHKSVSSEDCYLFWLRRYIRALRDMAEDLSREKKLERFLTDLAIREDVAATTQNRAFNAVVFFYKDVLEQPLGNVDALRAKRPVRERHAPSVADTQALLQNIRNRCGYFSLVLNGADGGGRTHTSLRIQDFESSASANSATSAT